METQSPITSLPPQREGSPQVNDLLQAFLDRAALDRRIGPRHISLYTVLLMDWYDLSCPALLPISQWHHAPRARLHRNTFYKTISDLDEFGFITYTPDYTPGGWSWIRLINPTCSFESI